MFGLDKLVLCVLLIVVAVVGALPMYPAEKRQNKVLDDDFFNRNDFMRFGKRSPGSELYDIDGTEFNRAFMNFGKRSPGSELYDIDGTDFNRAFVHFGKRDTPIDQIIADKKAFNREMMHFGKRSGGAEPFERSFMHFG